MSNTKMLEEYYHQLNFLKENRDELVDLIRNLNNDKTKFIKRIEYLNSRIERFEKAIEEFKMEYFNDTGD